VIECVSFEYSASDPSSGLNAAIYWLIYWFNGF
jgi:hypothetical protein